MVGYGFDSSLRLLTPADYQRVFDRADLKVSSRELLILARANHRPHPRLGLVIAKKNVRRAVQRNRIKRQIRETFRLNQDALEGLDAVVLARRGIDQLDNATLHQQLNSLWRQLHKRAQRLPREPAPTCSPGS